MDKNNKVLRSGRWKKSRGGVLNENTEISARERLAAEQTHIT